MGSLWDLLKQHQLPDIPVGGDSAGEVSLQGRQTPLQYPGQVTAGELHSNIDILRLVRILQADLSPGLADLNNEADILVSDGDSIQTWQPTRF